DEFRELCRYTLGSDELKAVRVAVHPIQTSQPIDARIVDLRVRADTIVGVEQLAESSPTAEAAATAVPKGRVGTVLVVGLVLTLALLGLGLWFYARRSRGPEETQSEPVA